MSDANIPSDNGQKSNVFSRTLGKSLPEATKAEGIWIEDSRGRRYLDASGGPILVNIGHGRKEIARVVQEQILKCDYVHGAMFTTSVVELSLGLSPKVTQEIYGTIQKLRREGVTILVIEQNATLALRHSDRGYVLETGRIALQGSSAELLNDDHIQKAYLGM